MAQRSLRTSLLIGVSAVTISGATKILTPMLDRHEGNFYRAYLDGAHVWTACRGIAYVPAHSVYTKAECDALNSSAEGKYVSAVGALVVQSTSDETLAAYSDLAYNIGLFGFSHSTVLKLNNEGKILESCDHIMDWDSVKGVDCEKTKGWTAAEGGCYGRYTRLAEDRDKCKEGAQNVSTQH